MDELKMPSALRSVPTTNNTSGYDERKVTGATILVTWPRDKFLDVVEVIAVDHKGDRHKLHVRSVFIGD